MKVAVYDVFLEAYGWMNRLVRLGYLLAINHTPRFWKLVFWILDRTSVVGGGIGIFGRAARRLAALLREGDPDVIVSTYPGYGHLLDHVVRRFGTRPVRLVTVVTDSITINSVWYRPRTDFFLVPNEPTARVMREAGVEAAKIRVTGFPVPLLFSTPVVRGDGPPWQVLYMVNSGHHRAAGIVRGLIKIRGIFLTVTAGRDETLIRELERLRAESGTAFEIHGWTPEIANLIRRSHVLISKAGGATVQEALAARTPMILSQIIPGQEEGNARLLLEAGCGELAESSAEIAAATEALFRENGALYRARYEATAAISFPNAAREAAACLRELVG